MNWKQILDGSKNLLLSNINKPLVQTRHCSDETSREKNKTNPVKKKVNKLDDRIRRSRLSLRRKTRWISCLSFSYLCLTCVPPDDRGVTDLEPDRPAPTLVEEADWTCKGIREKGLKYLWRNKFCVKI